MLDLICLFIDIKVRILGFRVQDSAIRNRAVKYSLIIIRLIPGYKGSQIMNNCLGPPTGCFKQPGVSVCTKHALFKVRSNIFWTSELSLAWARKKWDLQAGLDSGSEKGDIFNLDPVGPIWTQFNAFCPILTHFNEL